jgi:hypothetical protein
LNFDLILKTTTITREKGKTIVNKPTQWLSNPLAKLCPQLARSPGLLEHGVCSSTSPAISPSLSLSLCFHVPRNDPCFHQSPIGQLCHHRGTTLRLPLLFATAVAVNLQAGGLPGAAWAGTPFGNKRSTAACTPFGDKKESVACTPLSGTAACTSLRGPATCAPLRGPATCAPLRGTAACTACTCL